MRTKLTLKVDGREWHKDVTIERIVDAVEREMSTLDNLGARYARSSGFCIACGEEADGCEPDARRHLCDYCNERAVYGAAELLLYLP